MNRAVWDAHPGRSGLWGGCERRQSGGESNLSVGTKAQMGGAGARVPVAVPGRDGEGGARLDMQIHCDRFWFSLEMG